MRMNTINKKSLFLVRLTIFFTIFFSIWAFMGVLEAMRSNTVLPFHSNWLFIWLFQLAFALLMLVLFILTWNSKTSLWIIRFIEKIRTLKISKTLSLIIYVLLIIIIPCIVLFLDQLPIGVIILMHSSARIWFMWLFILAAALVLKISRRNISWSFSVAVTVITQAVIYSFLPISFCDQ